MNSFSHYLTPEGKVSVVFFTAGGQVRPGDRKAIYRLNGDRISKARALPLIEGLTPCLQG